MKGLYRLIVFLVLQGFLGFSIDSVVWAYKEAPVGNGGTLTGKVTLKGDIPEPRVFPVVLYPFGSFCKKISDGQGNIRLEEFVVGDGGGMQDAIVVVEGITAGKPFPPIQMELESEDCMFHPMEVADEDRFQVKGGKLRHAHPLVSVIQNHQRISVVNRDPIIHNGQVFQSERGNIILNFPLPVSDQPRGGVLDFEPGRRISEMICGMHEFMQSWGFVVDNPYYAKTKRDGNYAIDQLPPGTYRVTAWHPHLKMISREVIIPAGGTVSLDFEFDSKQVVRPHYESQEKFRVGPEAKPHEHLEECDSLYCE